MEAGGSIPMRSSSVGRMSMACTYWWRVPPSVPMPGRPMEDERVGHAALVGIALESLQRRVAGPGPAPRVVVVGPRSAEIVDPLEILLQALGDEVEEVLLVERPLRPTLGRRAVVAHDDDDGVLGLVELLNEVEDARHLRVGMGEEACVDLHHPGGETLFVGVQRLPGRDPRGAFGELGSLRQEARCQLPGEHLLSPLVPSLVEVLRGSARCSLGSLVRARGRHRERTTGGTVWRARPPAGRPR